MREYGALTTFVLASIFGFDGLWAMTSIDAIEAGFVALLIGIFATIVFAFITEPKPVKKDEVEYEFCTDNTGLSVLIRKGTS